MLIGLVKDVFQKLNKMLRKRKMNYYALVWQWMLDNLPKDGERTGSNRNVELQKDTENSIDWKSKQRGKNFLKKWKQIS